MFHFYGRITFITGILMGIILAFYFKKYEISRTKRIVLNRTYYQATAYNQWFQKRSLRRRPIAWDELRYNNVSFYTESDYLQSQVRILCVFIQKTPANVKAAQDTWAKGCSSIEVIVIVPRNKIMPSKRDKENSSWVLLCNFLSTVNISSFDWLLVVRDTSFVITENLRYYVAPLKPKKTYYLGHAAKFWGIAYNTGEPGYVLSQGTVLKFQKLFNNKQKCFENNYWNKEDYYLGKYLTALNVTPINTADDEGLTTFHPYNWYHVFNPGENYYKDSVFPVKCCSKRSIAFQATEGSRMYTYDYLFYKLQLFTGGQYGNRKFQDPIPEDQPWKDFLDKRNILHNVSSEEYYQLWEKLINDPNSFAANLKKEHLFDYD